jgi:hypothetical protein
MNRNTVSFTHPRKKLSEGGKYFELSALPLDIASADQHSHRNVDIAG